MLITGRRINPGGGLINNSTTDSRGSGSWREQVSTCLSDHRPTQQSATAFLTRLAIGTAKTQAPCQNTSSRLQLLPIVQTQPS